MNIDVYDFILTKCEKKSFNPIYAAYNYANRNRLTYIPEDRLAGNIYNAGFMAWVQSKQKNRPDGLSINEYTRYMISQAIEDRSESIDTI